MPNIVIQCKCIHQQFAWMQPGARQLSKKQQTIWTPIQSYRNTQATQSQNHFYRSNGGDNALVSFRVFFFRGFEGRNQPNIDWFLILILFQFCRYRNASSIPSIPVLIARQWTWRHRSDQRRCQLRIECHLPAKFTATARTSVQTNTR